jgi:hypothetical protein
LLARSVSSAMSTGIGSPLSVAGVMSLRCAIRAGRPGKAEILRGAMSTVGEALVVAGLLFELDSRLCETRRSPVLETRQRPDGATGRRRECTACSRRFSTEELPATEGWLGELPEADSGGPLETVRRRAILRAARDANQRELAEAIAELKEIVARQTAMLDAAETRAKEEAKS